MNPTQLTSDRKAPGQQPAFIRWSVRTLLPFVAALAGCQTTAGLPTVDDAQRRPINSAAAIELQSCKAEASALRTTLLEADALQCPRVEGAVKLTTSAPAPSPADSGVTGSSSRIAVFVFEQGQTTLSLDAATREVLRQAAAAAQVIHVRGRSGAAQESPADVLAARRRAEAAMAAMKELGVPAQKVKVTWQGMSDAHSEPGQARRVEIEFADRAPTLLFTRSAADKASTPVATPVPATPSSAASAPGPAVTTARAAAAKP